MAHLVALDLLQHAGTELLTWSYAERRAALESVFQGHGLQAPWALTPSTTDRALAEEWLTEWTAVGVEGLVIKGLEQTYQPGRRGWLKYRTRDTAEAVIGAVTGSVIRPETVLLGRYTSDGRILLVACSTPLAPRLRAELGGGLLTPRAPTTPGATFTSLRTGAAANRSPSPPWLCRSLWGSGTNSVRTITGSYLRPP